MNSNYAYFAGVGAAIGLFGILFCQRKKTKGEEIKKNLIVIDFPIKNRSEGLLSKLFGSSQNNTTIRTSFAIKINDRLRNIDLNEPIDIVINTTGGELTAIEMICKTLIKHKGKITAYIPKYCFSGGTYIALLADEIFMGRNAYIGPTDPQFNIPLIGRIPANAIIHSDHIESSSKMTAIMSYMANQARHRCDSLMKEIMLRVYSNSPDVIAKIMDELSSGKYEHSHIFTCDELQEYGLNVKKGVPEQIFNMVS